MSTRRAIVDFIKAYSPLNATLGSRVYDISLPPRVAVPAVTVRLTSGPVAGSQNSGGFRQERYQVASWADDAEVANTVAETLITALTDANISGIQSIRVVEKGPETIEGSFDPFKYVVQLQVLVTL